MQTFAEVHDMTSPRIAADCDGAIAGVYSGKEHRAGGTRHGEYEV